MSRMFSTSGRVAKALNWKLIGTKQPIEWVKTTVEAAVDQVPGLAGKVDSATINGDPHSTGNDPLHAAGVLGKKSMKGKNRVTSFHAYPDGTVKFSDKDLPMVKVRVSVGNEGEHSGSAYPDTTAANAPVASAVPQWEWDANTEAYRYWDGQQWIYQ
ncbi:MAG: hypothetical protein M1817_002436 [Caeruleum heppii]|nr:MAG: hypothetical protein M1817_002436 [Caeruleum heppii]